MTTKNVAKVMLKLKHISLNIAFISLFTEPGQCTNTGFQHTHTEWTAGGLLEDIQAVMATSILMI